MSNPNSNSNQATLNLYIHQVTPAVAPGNVSLRGDGYSLGHRTHYYGPPCSDILNAFAFPHARPHWRSARCC